LSFDVYFNREYGANHLTTYTNHTNAILASLKALLVAEFPDLAKRDRYIERPYPKSTDFAPEYTVRVKLISDQNMGQYAGGRFDEWTLELYFVHTMPETDYAKLTAYSERISAMLAANMTAENWLYVTEDTNYDPASIPQPPLTANETERRVDGFIMTGKVHMGKF
jgi:hypothetical protein